MSRSFLKILLSFSNMKIYDASLRVKIKLNRRNLQAHILVVFSNMHLMANI